MADRITAVQIEAREATVVSQQKSYEAVRSERNRYSRDLIAAQAEVAEARRKFQRVVCLSDRSFCDNPGKLTDTHASSLQGNQYPYPLFLMVAITDMPL